MSEIDRLQGATIRRRGVTVGRLTFDPRFGVTLRDVRARRSERRKLWRELRKARRYLMAGSLPPQLGEGFSIEGEIREVIQSTSV